MMPLPDAHKAMLYKVDPAAPTQEPPSSDPAVVLVQFNPASLNYSVQNTLEKKGRDANAKQFVAQTTAKLEFDLSFDSTHDGGDVRTETDRIKQFLNPGDKSQNADQAPPLVGFRWGTFVFKGIVESFKETLDFFSAEGVPLRSLLKIGLASQDPKDVFAALPPGHPDAAAAAGGDVQLAAVGERGASRDVAAANGFESMRNPGAGFAAVAGASVELKAAVGFSASVSAGIGIGGGVGIGAGAGLGIGGGVGIGIGASAGASSLQAFAGLGTAKAPTVRLPSASAQVALGTPGGSFALGGQAGVGAASVGLRADMGASARIVFDGGS
jgi:Contractile injection system tube protein